MAAASGTQRRQSHDEEKILSINAYKIFTDPYLIDSFQINNETVAQYPRAATFTGALSTAPDNVGSTYIYLQLTAPTVSNNTFATKIPVIDHPTEVTHVPATTTQLYFPKGGLWEIHVYFKYGTPQSAVNTYAIGVLEYSSNGGIAYEGVSRAVTTIPAVGGPTFDTCSLSWIHYFGPASGVQERIRIGIAANFAMATGIRATWTLVKLRN